MKISNKSLSLIFYVLCVSFIINVCVALQAISQGQSLAGKLSLISEGGNFELGFFRPGKPRNFYIGIWYKKIKKQTVIWVANRDMPVNDIYSSELKLAEDGNLVLLNHSKVPIWSSNTNSSTAKSVEAVLLDNGNLVLRVQQNTSMILWQSFDHPTDTFIPGGWLGMNKITGEYQSLVSWKNTEDPATGIFTDTIDPSGSDQFVVLWNQTQRYWRSGIWDGHYFTLIPEMTQGHALLSVSFDDNELWKRVTFSLFNSSTITRQVMDLTGQIKQFVWLDSIQDWSMFWSAPLVQCNVYSLCGAYGVCNQKISPPCSCPQGFNPASPRDWERNDWSAGCRRISGSQCSGKDQFNVMPNMQPSTDSQALKVQSPKECKLACLKTCSCVAYAYEETNQCLIWNKKIDNLQQLDSDNGKSLTLYLRADGLQPHDKGERRLVLITAVVITGFLASTVIITIILAWRHRRKTVAESIKELKGSLIFFSYADLRRATLKFSDKLGEGSFGSVYKGALKDSRAIAVKKLEGLRQGEKQFRTEVNSLGQIQHLNLVQLIGFCSEGARKLLVYEFMSNGSLASFLSEEKYSPNLTWEARYGIAIGIARGLAYLHEECRDCIIHCDIKPENILLDADLRPKIADFGMAKLIERDISRVLTTMRGTIGYLAPEWLSGLPITTKADVYSYGMMLFELVSGRRNVSSANVTETGYFPAWAASRTIGGDVHSLVVDDRIKEDVDLVELERVCKVACWCIQDWEADRPSMTQVVQIMEGIVEMNMPSLPRSLQHVGIKESYSAHIFWA